MLTTRLRVGPRPTIFSSLGGLLLAAFLTGGCGQDLEPTDPSDDRDTTVRRPDPDTGSADGVDTAPVPPETGVADAGTDGGNDVGPAELADTNDAGDTSDGDTAAPPTRISLRHGDRPVPGATVVFHDRDGQVLGREMTDADGRASHVVPDGSMVTYGFGGVGSAPVFRTVTGVRAGESLEIRVAADETPSPVGTARIVLPPESPNADRYEVSIGCNSSLVMPGTRSVELDILDSCPNGGDEFDVVVRAFDGETPLAYAAARDVRRTTGGDTRIELAAWKRDWVRKSVDVINAPQAGAPIRARLGLGVDGQRWRIGETRVPLDGSGDGAATFAFPPDLAESVTYRTGIWEAQSGGQPHVMSIVRGNVADTTSSPITVDLQSDLLPMLELVGILQQIPERPSISWVAYDDLSEADVGVAVFTWTDADDNKQQWHAYVPPTRESNVRFPELPDLYASLAPTNPSSFKVGVAFVDRADLDGYADLRDRGTIEPLDHLADGTHARITRLGFF